MEGRQIYKILSSNQRKGAWTQHPAVKMWRNYDMGLYSYLTAIRDECDYRGINWEKNWDAIENMHENNWNRGNNIVMPYWWGDERVHQSHRNNLYRKDSDHYAEFINDKFIACCSHCNYWWPSHKAALV